MQPLIACSSGSSLQDKFSCRFVLNTTILYRLRGHWFIKQRAQESAVAYFPFRLTRTQWRESFCTYSMIFRAFMESTLAMCPSWLHSCKGVQLGTSLNLPIELNNGCMKNAPWGPKVPPRVSLWDAALVQLCPAACSQRTCWRRYPGVAGSIYSKLKIVL